MSNLESTDNYIDFLNNSECNDNDICVICREKLKNSQYYSLPECNHKFHTDCIISWFRQGIKRCPLCNNKGLYGTNNYFTCNVRYNILRDFSKTKKCPKFFKKKN